LVHSALFLHASVDLYYAKVLGLPRSRRATDWRFESENDLIGLHLFAAAFR
jgi:hypothetical protein